MADWENIPRLDPALQDEIDNVQLKHNALVKAVRSYPGGSIAGKTNEVMGTHQDNLDTVAAREKTLLSAIGQPEPAPSMLLDFASQTYFTGIRGLEQAVDPHKYLNVSRATPKWVMGPQGKLVEVPPDTLAYEYDPVTGEAKGVLIEESRTNLAIGSSDFSYWDRNGIDSITPGIADGKGSAALSEIIERTSEGYHEVRQSITANDGEPLAISFTWKPTGARSLSIYCTGFDSGGWGTLVIFRSDGSVGGAGVSLVASAYQTQLPNGSFAATIITNPIGGPGDSGRIIFRMFNDDLSTVNYTGDGTSSVLLGEVQVEVGSTPTSYIPTEDAPVTRAADNVIRELGDEFNNNGFTIYAEGVQGSDIGSLFYMRGADGLANSLRVGVPTNGGRAMYFQFGSSIVATAELSVFPSYTIGEPARVAVSVDTDTGRLVLAINGESIDRKPSNIPRLTRLVVGNVAGNNNNINGAMSGVALYPYALTETELEELTANG